MTFEIDPAPYVWWPWLLLLIPIAAITICLLVPEDHGWQGPVFAVSVGGGVFFAVLYGVVFAPEAQEEQNRVQKVEELENLGFQNVDLLPHETQFTASRGGDYYRGVLTPLGDHKYQVNEIVEGK